MPTYTVSQLFDGPFATQADFTALVSRWATVISESGTYSSADFTTLDIDESGVLDYDDLDMHLHDLVNKFYPVEERLPTSWDNANSDPLGLRSLRGGNTVIVDPQSATAVNVTPGANTCTTQAGASAGNLFSSDTYLQTLWLNLVSLDETGSVSIRRFPTNGGKVTIYVRGGTQNVTEEVRVLKGTGSWTALDRITIRAYPGERPTIHLANSQYTTGSVDRQGKWALDVVLGFTTRPNVRLFDLWFVGYVQYGFGKVYAPQAISFGSGATNWWIRGGGLVDCFGIQPTHSRAAEFPEQVDRTFLIRCNDAATLYAASDVGQGRGLALTSTAGKIENWYLRPTALDFPYSQDDTDDVFNHEGILMTTCNGVEITGCKMEGMSSHAMIWSVNCLNVTITYNDLSNLAHTVLIVLGNDSSTGGSLHTIEYNRIHTYATVSAVIANAIECVGMSSSTIRYNTIYNDGLEYDYSGVELAATIGSSNDCHDNTVSFNILKGVSLGLEYTSTKCGTPGANMIYDNDISSNIIEDAPDANVASTYYGAPLRLGLDQPLTNNNYGNTITSNIIRNTRGSYQVSTSTRGLVTTNYATTSTTIPGMSGNVTTDPLFLDAANGDFLMGNSTAAALVAGAPLAPTQVDAGDRPEPEDIESERKSASDAAILRFDDGADTSLRTTPSVTGMARV